MSAFNKLKAYEFAIKLSRSFEKWDAFELGLIDKDGELIKRPKTKEEKDSLDTFDNLIRKVKRLLLKYIPGKNLFSFIISAYLLKQEGIINGNNNVIDEINEILSDDEQACLITNLLNCIKMNIKT